MDLESYKQQLKPTSKTIQVFKVLEDKKWHCRNHEYKHIRIGQLAGSGGIQGLERGTIKRAGIVIKSKNRICDECNTKHRHDKWIGAFSEQTNVATLSDKLCSKILHVLGYTDVVDCHKRPTTELTIDHKFPMIRWNSEYGNKDRNDMSESDIKKRF